MYLRQTEPWLFGSPSPQGCLPRAKPPRREGPCLCIYICTRRRAHVRLGRQPVCSFPTAGGGSLPSSSLQSHYMQDQVCAVPDFCTAASVGSSGELSTFVYLPVWLTMQYMKLWSIELCYLKGWGFFLFPFLFGLCGGECLAGFSFFFSFSFLPEEKFSRGEQPFSYSLAGSKLPKA